MRTPEDKILTIEEAVAWRRELRARQVSLVVTNGCFDILHRGHVSYLSRARQVGGALLVAVNSDLSVRALKGPGRPVNHEEDRVYLLAALEAVDAVVVFDTLTATAVLRAIEPDLYVKGGDYDVNTIPGEERAVLEASDSRIVFLPFIDGFSTTGLIHKIHQHRES